jgi:hypothetical protein
MGQEFFFLLFYLSEWGLNSGLCGCKSEALTFEYHLQPIFLWLFWIWGLTNYLPGCPQAMILISASQVIITRITDMTDQYPTWKRVWCSESRIRLTRESSHQRATQEQSTRHSINLFHPGGVNTIPRWNSNPLNSWQVNALDFEEIILLVLL